ncbi:MAG: insulinase family protein [Duncaniella sp.]|nr:insulinase family protein [Duncaniella sp.]
MQIPEIREIGHLSQPEYNTLTLPNGVRLHTILSDESDVCRLSLIIPGGNAESPSPKGAVLANMLLAEGTVSHSGEQIADSLDFEGAWWGPSMATHHSVLNFFSLSEKMESIVDTAIEMLTEAVFPADAVESRKQQMRGVIEMQSRQVSEASLNAMNALMFQPGTPLATAPSVELIDAVTPGMLRDFHYSRIVPEQMHCCIAGHLDAQSLERIAAKIGAIKPSAPAYDFASLGLREQYESTTERVKIGDAVQASVRIAVPTIGRQHPDYVALRFAVIALGGGFGSRLMSTVREEMGLTYGINASLIGYPGRGFATIGCQTKSPDEVIEECERQLGRLADASSYTGEELTRLRRYVLSSLASTLDTPFSRMDYLQTCITADIGRDYFDSQQTLARNLSAEVLADVAGRYLSGARLVVVADK